MIETMNDLFDALKLVIFFIFFGNFVCSCELLQQLFSVKLCYAK